MLRLQLLLLLCRYFVFGRGSNSSRNNRRRKTQLPANSTRNLKNIRRTLRRFRKFRIFKDSKTYVNKIKRSEAVHTSPASKPCLKSEPKYMIYTSRDSKKSKVSKKIRSTSRRFGIRRWCVKFWTFWNFRNFGLQSPRAVRIEPKLEVGAWGGLHTRTYIYIHLV